MLFGLFRKGPKRDYQYLTNELEKEKQKLISELETNGIRFLIDKMACKDDYSPLIEERRKIQMNHSSNDAVSTYAYRQSSKLNSPADKQELLQMLSDPAYQEKKLYIYCCLSSICSNTNDVELFNFLIQQVQEDDNERIVISILSRVRNMKKDLNYNIEPIKKIVTEGTYHESMAAMMALSYTEDAEVEDILLYEFKITDKHMQGMICSPLGTVGTIRSIPVLKEVYKKTRDPFLRSAIEGTIQQIEERGNQEHKL